MLKKHLSTTHPPDSPNLEFCTVWHIPHWKDAAAYPNAPAALSPTHWRWEFLRRLQAYRDDWTAHVQGTYKYLLSKSKGKKNILRPDHPQFRVTGTYLRADAQPGTDQERAAFRCIQALRTYRLIGGLPNPAIREPFMLEFKPTFGGMIMGRGDVEELRIEKDHVWYQFDLTRPIPPQIEKATEDLLYAQLWQRERKERRRVNERLFPRYLRVLDARDCGATYKDIGTLLLGIADYDKAAKRGQDLHRQALFLQANLPRYFSDPCPRFLSLG